MGSRGGLDFDLNEPPAEEFEERGLFLHPQKFLPSNLHTSDLLASEGHKAIVNNHTFSHASSASGFQPFNRRKDMHNSKEYVTQEAGDLMSNSGTSFAAVNYSKENEEKQLVSSGAIDAQAVDREEGEWSEMEFNADTSEASTSSKKEGTFRDNGETGQKQGEGERADLIDYIKGAVVYSVKDENDHASLGLESEPLEHSHNSSRNSDCNTKGDIPVDGLEESSSAMKQKEIKGTEASHALKCANNPAKRHKLDEHKEAMLGKKRSRQTMFLNLEDVKQAGSIKALTPRRQTFSSPIITRTVKDLRTVPALADHTGEKQELAVPKDHKQIDAVNTEVSTPLDISYHKAEVNGDINTGLKARPKKLNGGTDSSVEAYPPPIPRQGSWKQPTDYKEKHDELDDISLLASQMRASLSIVQMAQISVTRVQKCHDELKRVQANCDQHRKALEESKVREKEYEETHQALFSELDKAKSAFELVKRREAELKRRIAGLERQKAELEHWVQTEVAAAFQDGVDVAGEEYSAQVDDIRASSWEMGWRAALAKAGIPRDHPAYVSPDEFPRPEADPTPAADPEGDLAAAPGPETAQSTGAPAAATTPAVASSPEVPPVAATPPADSAAPPPAA